MKPLFYLGLGSNLGDREENLLQAQAAIGGIEARSSLYETEPVDYLDQPWFLNCVIGVRTDLSPRELLARCQQIETALGRVRGIPKGPRVIDIDLLLAGGTVIREEGLVIPHPGLAVRRFVLEPLAEIAPDAVHPLLGGTIRSLLAACPDNSAVRRLDWTRA